MWSVTQTFARKSDFHTFSSEYVRKNEIRSRNRHADIRKVLKVIFRLFRANVGEKKKCARSAHF